MWKQISVLAIWVLISLSACRKKDLPSPVTAPIDTSKGKIAFRLNNVVGTTPLVTDGSTVYSLSNGDKFSVIIYNYYISNIVLVDNKGNRFVEPESYHLAMSYDSSSLQFSIANVPNGKYTSVEFLIGVDSLGNVSGAQTGGLDPKFGMIWDWNTGYIMAKMEGRSIGGITGSKTITYHIAGYKAPYSVIQKVSLSFNQAATVSYTHVPVVHMQSDLATWFAAPGFDGFAATPSITVTGAKAMAIAQNYRNMFSITSVDN